MAHALNEDLWERIFLWSQPLETEAQARTARAVLRAQRRDGLWRAFADPAAGYIRPRLWCALSKRSCGARKRFKRAARLRSESVARENSNPRTWVRWMRGVTPLDPAALTVVIIVTQGGRAGDPVRLLARCPFEKKYNEWNADWLEFGITAVEPGDVIFDSNFAAVPEIWEKLTARPSTDDDPPWPDPDTLTTTMLVERADGRVAHLINFVPAQQSDWNCSSCAGDEEFAIDTYYDADRDSYWMFNLALRMSFPDPAVVGPEPDGGCYGRIESVEVAVGDCDPRQGCEDDEAWERIFPDFLRHVSGLRWY